MKRIASLIFLCLFVLPPSGTKAQTPTLSPSRVQPVSREKPKLKDFGSSLKRLKWDEKKSVAVETKQKKEKAKISTDQDVLKIETNLVVSDILVMDERGRAVQGLTRDDFVVTEDNKPQVISSFSLGDNADVPRSIVLVIDYSPSQKPFIKTSITAAKTLVDKLGPRDRMAIVTDDVELLADFTQDKETLKKRLDSLEKAATSGNGGYFGRGPGKSYQFSALMASLRELFDNEDARPIIIFQTDGDEVNRLRPNEGRTPFAWPKMPLMNQLYPSLMLPRYPNTWDECEDGTYPVREFSLADIWKTAEESRVTVYSVISGVRLIGLPEDEQLERAKRMLELFLPDLPSEVRRGVETALKKGEVNFKGHVNNSLRMQWAVASVAQVTGGWTGYLEEPAQAETVYSGIFTDINRRYIIGYYPTNKEHDGKRRTVKVEVRGHPEYVVWGRKAYYASGPDE